MPLPLLRVVQSAIAGKKLVAVARLDDAHRGIGPREAVTRVRDRRLSFVAGREPLRRRRHDSWSSHCGLAHWTQRLREASSRKDLDNCGKYTEASKRAGKHKALLKSHSASEGQRRSMKE